MANLIYLILYVRNFYIIIFELNIKHLTCDFTQFQCNSISYFTFENQKINQIYFLVFVAQRIYEMPQSILYPVVRMYSKLNKPSNIKIMDKTFKNITCSNRPCYMRDYFKLWLFKSLLHSKDAFPFKWNDCFSYQFTRQADRQTDRHPYYLYSNFGCNSNLNYKIID